MILAVKLLMPSTVLVPPVAMLVKGDFAVPIGHAGCRLVHDEKGGSV